MDSKQFREAAISSIDDSKFYKFQFNLSIQVSVYRLTTGVVVKYYDTIEERRVASNVEPGYLRKLLPEEAPQNGEPWADIQKDIEAKILPGITHWFVMDLELLLGGDICPLSPPYLPLSLDTPKNQPTTGSNSSTTFQLHHSIGCSDI